MQPLGGTGGAGGVHEGGDVARLGRGDPLEHLLARDLATAMAKVLQRHRPVGGFEQDDVLERGTAVADLCDLRRLGGVIAKHQARLGMPEHVGALLRRVGVVDRRHDRAGTERAAVGQRPLRRGQAEDRDSVARLDAKADQALGDRRADLAQSGVTDVSRVFAAGKLKGDPAEAPRRLEDHLANGLRRDAEASRGGEFATAGGEVCRGSRIHRSAPTRARAKECAQVHR